MGIDNAFCISRIRSPVSLPEVRPISVDGVLVYGNWSDLIVAFWSGIDLLLNPFHTDVFAKGGALLSAFIDFDIQVRHALSFAKADDITLTV